MTNEQINERIAFLQGWKRGETFTWELHTPDGIQGRSRLLEYTTHAYYAMELAKEMMAVGFKLKIYRTMLAYDDAYECTATNGGIGGGLAKCEIYTHAAPTIEVAICLVWLDWKESGE